MTGRDWDWLQHNIFWSRLNLLYWAGTNNLNGRTEALSCVSKDISVTVNGKKSQYMYITER